MLVLTLKPEGQNSCEQHSDVGLVDAIQKSSASKTEVFIIIVLCFPRVTRILFLLAKLLLKQT